MINEHDKKLIKTAKKIPYTENWKVSDMENYAETEEGKKEIHRIYIRKYHEEEWSADML